MVTSVGPLRGAMLYRLGPEEHNLLSVLARLNRKKMDRTLSAGRLMCLAAQTKGVTHVARVGQHEDGTWWVQEITSVPAEIHEHEV